MEVTISSLWSAATRFPGLQPTTSRRSRPARTPASTRSSGPSLNRDASGKVDVAEHDSGAHVAGGAVLGGTAGLVVGLFPPPLLAATAVGAGIGAVVGKLKKKHEEKIWASRWRSTFRRNIRGRRDRRRHLRR